MGAPDERAATEQLLREHPEGCDGRRPTRLLRHLLRHDRRTGLWVGERRRQLGANRQGPPCSAVGRSADTVAGKGI